MVPLAFGCSLDMDALTIKADLWVNRLFARKDKDTFIPGAEAMPKFAQVMLTRNLFLCKQAFQCWCVTQFVSW